MKAQSVTKSLKFSQTDNGLFRVTDGSSTRIFAITYRPEYEALIGLNFRRSQINEQMRSVFHNDGDAAEMQALAEVYRRLTQQIKAEARRLSLPGHLPYTH